MWGVGTKVLEGFINYILTEASSPTLSADITRGQENNVHFSQAEFPPVPIEDCLQNYGNLEWFTGELSFNAPWITYTVLTCACIGIPIGGLLRRIKKMIVSNLASTEIASLRAENESLRSQLRLAVMHIVLGEGQVDKLLEITSFALLILDQMECNIMDLVNVKSTGLEEMIDIEDCMKMLAASFSEVHEKRKYYKNTQRLTDSLEEHKFPDKDIALPYEELGVELVKEKDTVYTLALNKQESSSQGFLRELKTKRDNFFTDRDKSLSLIEAEYRGALERLEDQVHDQQIEFDNVLDKSFEECDTQERMNSSLLLKLQLERQHHTGINASLMTNQENMEFEIHELKTENADLRSILKDLYTQNQQLDEDLKRADDTGRENEMLITALKAMRAKNIQCKTETYKTAEGNAEMQRQIHMWEDMFLKVKKEKENLYCRLKIFEKNGDGGINSLNKANRELKAHLNKLITNYKADRQKIIEQGEKKVETLEESVKELGLENERLNEVGEGLAKKNKDLLKYNKGLKEDNVQLIAKIRKLKIRKKKTGEPTHQDQFTQTTSAPDLSDDRQIPYGIHNEINPSEITVQNNQASVGMEYAYSYQMEQNTVQPRAPTGSNSSNGIIRHGIHVGQEISSDYHGQRDGGSSRPREQSESQHNGSSQRNPVYTNNLQAGLNPHWQNPQYSNAYTHSQYGQGEP